jgi:hypothetical protein
MMITLGKKRPMKSRSLFSIGGHKQLVMTNICGDQIDDVGTISRKCDVL